MTIYWYFVGIKTVQKYVNISIYFGIKTYNSQFFKTNIPKIDSWILIYQLGILNKMKNFNWPNLNKVRSKVFGSLRKLYKCYSLPTCFSP